MASPFLILTVLALIFAVLSMIWSNFPLLPVCDSARGGAANRRSRRLAGEVKLIDRCKTMVGDLAERSQEIMIATEISPAEIAEEVRLIEQMQEDERRSDEFLASLEHERERPRASYLVDPALISWQI